MGRLTGKVAVITGANSGIGLETAKRFVEEGAQVVITGRRKDELVKAAAEIGENVVAVQGDVSHLEDLDRLYAEVKAKFGHIDILFANAGLGQVAPLGAVTEEHFDREFDVNVKGLFFSVQKALPLFKDGGSIILNSSVAGHKGIGGFSVYSATKAAVRSFARSWTSDLKDRKIRVNAISAGPVNTLAARGIAGFTQMLKHYEEHAPLKRNLEPRELGSTGLFLASDMSTATTGQTIYVDCGYEIMGM